MQYAFGFAEYFKRGYRDVSMRGKVLVIPSPFIVSLPEDLVNAWDVHSTRFSRFQITEINYLNKPCSIALAIAPVRLDTLSFP
jgi:hypothetical protein